MSSNQNESNVTNGVAPKKRVILTKGKVEIVKTDEVQETKKKSTKKSVKVSKPTAKFSGRTSTVNKNVNSSKPSSKPKQKIVKKKAPVETKNTKSVKKSKTVKNTELTSNTNLDMSGIGIGPAKVKKILTHTCFNKREYDARTEILKSENKLVAKPTKDNPDPVTNTKVPSSPKNPIPVCDIKDENVQEVLRHAEEEHLKSLYEDYVHDVVKHMNDKDRYIKERKEASKSPNFDLRAFNLEFDKKFYDDFPRWCELNDLYSINREVTKTDSASVVEKYEEYVLSTMEPAKKAQYLKERKEASKRPNFDLSSFNRSYSKTFYSGYDAWLKEADLPESSSESSSKKEEKRRTISLGVLKYNQWTRAAALINKSCFRLSNNVRDILACYLSNMVVQYAKNGVYNAIRENSKHIKLQHALMRHDAFDDLVPVDPFVRSLDGYQMAVNYVNELERVYDEKRDVESGGNKTTVTPPEYPDPKYDETFENYVGDICKSVRYHMAVNDTLGLNDKDKYYRLQIKADFKKFCSIIIYESVLRVGNFLKEYLVMHNVKTVKEQLMYHALKQISNLCGIDYTPVEVELKQNLEKFKKWCDVRKKKRNESQDKSLKHTKSNGVVREVTADTEDKDNVDDQDATEDHDQDDGDDQDVEEYEDDEEDSSKVEYDEV